MVFQVSRRLELIQALLPAPYNDYICDIILYEELFCMQISYVHIVCTYRIYILYRHCYMK